MITNERVRKYRATPKGKAANDAGLRRLCSRRRQILNDIKMESGCVDCGFRGSPVALQFDHVRGEKAFAIGARLNASAQRMEAEIAKCEVVCANCHAIRTHSRLDPSSRYV